VPEAVALAQTTQVSFSQKGTLSDPSSKDSNPLCRLNFLVGGCSGGSTTATQGGQSQAKNQQSGGLFASLFAAIFGSGSSASAKNTVTAVITLVRVPEKTEVYRIIGGKKHIIPTKEIFDSYGFTDAMVQTITAKQLAKYPRAKLITVNGDKTNAVYYFTETGTLRQVLNDKVMASYGDTKDDIVVINQKEFNYYPRNKFVFVASPTVNRDVFQLVDGTKRYLTPMALRRMSLRNDEITPINISELDEYAPGQPIIF